MLVHVVCVNVEWVSVWRGEGGGGSIVAQFYLREIVFLEKLVCICCMFLLMRYTVL